MGVFLPKKMSLMSHGAFFTDIVSNANNDLFWSESSGAEHEVSFQPELELQILLR